MKLITSLLVAVSAMLMLTGCHKSGIISACKDVNGACISVRVEGNLKQLTQVEVTLDRPTLVSRRTPATANGTFDLPIKFALVPPVALMGQVTVGVTAYQGDIAVSSSEQTVTVTNAAVEVVFTLSAGMKDGGSGADLAGADLTGADLFGADLTNTDDLIGADLTPPPDLLPPPDLVPPITITTTGATTVYELDTLNVSYASPDAPTGTITITSTGTPPTGMTIGPPGTSSTVMFSPTVTQAGIYPLTITLTDASSNVLATKLENIVVKNTLDEVFTFYGTGEGVGSGADIFPLEDWDGDGDDELVAFNLSRKKNGTSWENVYTTAMLLGNTVSFPLTASLLAGIPLADAHPALASDTRNTVSPFWYVTQQAVPPQYYLQPGGAFMGERVPLLAGRLNGATMPSTFLFLDDQYDYDGGSYFGQLFYAAPGDTSASRAFQSADAKPYASYSNTGTLPFRYTVGDFLKGDGQDEIVTIEYSYDGESNGQTAMVNTLDLTTNPARKNFLTLPYLVNDASNPDLRKVIATTPATSQLVFYSDAVVLTGSLSSSCVMIVDSNVVPTPTQWTKYIYCQPELAAGGLDSSYSFKTMCDVNADGLEDIVMLHQRSGAASYYDVAVWLNQAPTLTNKVPSGYLFNVDTTVTHEANNIHPLDTKTGKVAIGVYDLGQGLDVSCVHRRGLPDELIAWQRKGNWMTGVPEPRAYARVKVDSTLNMTFDPMPDYFTKTFVSNWVVGGDFNGDGKLDYLGRACAVDLSTECDHYGNAPREFVVYGR